MSLSKVKENIRRVLVHTKWSVLLRRPSGRAPEDAFNALYAYYPKDKPQFSQINHIDPIFDLHIIVPVYNVGRYLEDCILSLIHQKTRFCYHITLVNDGSTDVSTDILQKYCDHPLFTVMNKDNGGLSSARNMALQEICGKYVMFLDSDDILHENAVQALLGTAFENNADIVEGSHQCFSSSGGGSSHIHGTEPAKSNMRELFGYAWGKVIKSDLLRNFCFPPDFLFEDTVMSTLLHPYCPNIYTLPEVTYFYRKNEMGISESSRVSRRCIDTFWIMKYCLEERVRRGQILNGNDLDQYLYACYRNWGRTNMMPQHIQESIFVLSCEMIEQNFCAFLTDYCGQYPKLVKTVQARSFDAFNVLSNNWWMM